MLAKRMNWQNLLLESNSETAIRLFQVEIESISEDGTWIQDIKVLVQSIRDFSFVHVSCLNNVLAHCLVVKAVRNNWSLLWVSNFPTWLTYAAREEFSLFIAQSVSSFF